MKSVLTSILDNNELKMKIESFLLDRDIPVHCLTATSFPEGIQAVHDKMDSLVPFAKGRNCFGLSQQNESGVIVYKSGVEEFVDGELNHLLLEKIIIKKGTYSMIIIPDFFKNIPAIGEAFGKLISQPGIDPNGWCVEWILRNNVLRCMVRMAD